MKLLTSSRLFQLDWGIIISFILLILMSLATLYSLELNQENPDFSLLERQALSAVIGVIFFYLLLRIDYRYLRDYALFIYGFGLLLLLGVLFFGVSIHGTTGWFRVGGITLQPVEFFKMALIIALSYFFSAQKYMRPLVIMFGSFSIVILGALLVYFQPDLGSMIVLIVIWFGMLFVRRLKWQYILFIFLCGFLSLLVAWQFVFEPYQKERIITFLNPRGDISGAGYNVIQSRIAIGSGRLFGRGLGLGTQSSLNFLPEQETDFIFAVITESLGFLGGALVVLIYTFLLWRVLKFATYVQDEFGVFLAIGIFFWFGFQGLANIAMNMGIAPVFGVPIPFLSYGGSSLLSSILAIGILESVALHSRRQEV